MIQTVLIANRAAIASRVIRACRKLQIRSIAVYAEVDAQAPFVHEADLAIPLSGETALSAYLDAPQIIQLAQLHGADAIHPGYGFLSENEHFAAACVEAGLIFVGPSAEVIRRMGDKQEAKACAEAAYVPIVPGARLDGLDDNAIAQQAEGVGFPLLVKAAAGGGGKGMRRVDAASELLAAVAAARREAQAAFGDDAVFLEKYIEQPRHIEIQILADQHGTVVHLGERDCSSQRRHQKIIEEAPSPAVNEDLRERMGQCAVQLAADVGYVNAGTVEFLLDRSGEFYFLEMNTRLQVEHAVTEEVYNIDLVEWQLRVAQNEALNLQQAKLVPQAHAIECRLYAEDPANHFLPVTGTVLAIEWPRHPGSRVESAVVAGSEVSVDFDPMLAKIITRGESRANALDRMIKFLDALVISGVTTNREFLLQLLSHERFASGTVDTGFVESALNELLCRAAAYPDHFSTWAQSHLAGWRLGVPQEQTVTVQPRARSTRRSKQGAQGDLTAPMPGCILEVAVQAEAKVQSGDVLVVMEAMKMEYTIKAPQDGTVTAVHVNAGDMVAKGKQLVELQ